MTTIRDVAALAGVHPSTVSRVLSGKAPITAEVTERVRSAAHKLGFKINRAARVLGLRENLPTYAAVILPRIDHPFFQRILKGLHQGLFGAGVGILVLTLEPEPLATQELLKRLDPDILLPVSLSIDHNLDLSGHNVLWLDSGIGLPGLDIDHKLGGYLAADYLAEKRVTYPLFLAEKKTTPGQTARLASFTEKWTGEIGIFSTVQNREQAYVDFLSKARHKKFDGIFCFCDEIAFGIQKALKELNLNIPLIGYDDHPDAAISGLTTIAQPAEELGRRAGELVKDYLAGKGWPDTRVLLPPRLQIRNN